MIRQIRCLVSAFAGAAVLASASVAPAQWFPSAGCGCAAPAANPTPIAHSCVEQVPVTQYQQVKQKVRRPVREVEYVEQPVTTYRPVTETKTVEVPVTTYQNVTEYQTQVRRGGRWKTNYYRNPKSTPCQYDPSPTAIGWLNRTAYRIRSAFTPDVITTRQYVPQTCTVQVPVNRQVAVQTKQKRTYKVTRYVPEQTTRKVAVSKVRWVEDEVVAMKPVTVMQSVPVTRTAWGWSSYNPTAISYAAPPTTISLAPTPDPVSTSEAPSSSRSASRNNDDINSPHDDRGEVKKIEKNQEPVRRSTKETPERDLGHRSDLFEPVRPRSAGAAGLARVGGWRASKKKGPAAPILPPVSMPVAAAH